MDNTPMLLTTLLYYWQHFYAIDNPPTLLPKLLHYWQHSYVIDNTPMLLTTLQCYWQHSYVIAKTPHFHYKGLYFTPIFKLQDNFKRWNLSYIKYILPLNLSKHDLQFHDINHGCYYISLHKPYGACCIMLHQLKHKKCHPVICQHSTPLHMCHLIRHKT